MKYIFIVGAPGSKWSSVARNIYYSSSIDQTDSSKDREYLNQQGQVGHCGAYFDPGMEFELPLDIHLRSQEEAEAIFDQPFSGTGIRIIKSHTLSHHIDYIKNVWPDSPVVLVHRSNDSCLGWWVRAGGFDITYPDYRPYYQNYAHMAHCIDHQNMDILSAWNRYQGYVPGNNASLSAILGIAPPPEQYKQDYTKQDIAVKVI